jgi:hypothetical protein
VREMWGRTGVGLIPGQAHFEYPFVLGRLGHVLSDQ